MRMVKTIRAYMVKILERKELQVSQLSATTFF